jgi:hypothetical protein
MPFNWMQLGLDISGETIGDNSGYSVSLSADGTIVAIGANYNDDRSIYKYDSGHVRIYKYLNNTWTQLGQDIDGEDSSDGSGYSVSLSADGTIVAIGAPWNDGSGNNSGHVRIYKYLNDEWSQLGADIDGKNSSDGSGRSVALSADGSTVAIGHSPYTSGGGLICVYKYLNNAWTQLGTDINGESNGDGSGTSVSLSADGTIVAVGAPFNDGSGYNSGHVRIYKYLNDVWSQLGSDIDGLWGVESGSSVSLSADGTIVAIGAPYDDAIGGNSGHVRIYKYLNDTWSQLGADIDGKAQFNHFGVSVSLSANGSIVAIGSASDSLYVSGLSGYVSVYEYLNDAWTKLGADIDAKYFRNPYSNSFVSLSADGKNVAIGDPGFAGNVPGYVRVYEYINILSPTCFPAGTLVLTDQGEISIENIDCNTNTIRGKKIVAITKTVTIEDKIVCIEKDALSQNVPSQKMCISRNHKLLFNKEMIKAKNLIGQVEGVYYKKYNGEILYNVLMETHNKMIINNVIVETLDPNNIVAKLYDGSLNLEERNTIIVNINQYANYCKKEYSKLR